MRFTKEDNLISRRLAEEAIFIDPEYGGAYYLLATTHMLDVWLRATKSPKQSLEKAIELARKAISLGGTGSHALLGWLYAMTRQHDKAIAECQQAVDLYPNLASAHAWYGMVLNSTGRFEEAVPVFEQAICYDSKDSIDSKCPRGFHASCFLNRNRCLCDRMRF